MRKERIKRIEIIIIIMITIKNGNIIYTININNLNQINII